MSRHLTPHVHSDQVNRPKHGLYPPRFLLAFADPAFRRAIAHALEAEGVEVALVAGAAQAVARAVIACCEPAARRGCSSDFDLVLIQAELLNWPLDFADSLHEGGFGGVMIAVAQNEERLEEFLEAGFHDLLTIDPARPLDCIAAISESVKLSLLPRRQESPHRTISCL